jgi:MFS family permease
MLLQAGQLLSNLGTRLTSIAYPLLVLGMTGSAAKAGFVAFARVLPLALFTLPAGVAADRWNRKWLMIAADGVRAVAVGILVATIVLDSGVFWAIPLIAFVEGAGAAFFAAAYPGAVRSVVPVPQLPDAAAAQTGRNAFVQVAGSPLGGALYTVGRSVPFVVDALSYAFSAASLLAMRAPFQEQREHDPSPLRSRLVEGIRYVWSRPFLRTCALVFGLLNFVGQSLLFALVVVGTDQGLSGGAVGLLVAVFFGAVLAGTFVSPLVRRVLPVHAVLVLELWMWVGCAAFLVWPNVYVLAVSMIPVGLAIPSTDSVVHGYRIAMTPDRLLGRAESAWTTIALVITPLGPLVVGLLITSVSARAAVGLCATVALALAVWATLSPSIRSAPSLDELAEVAVTGPASLVELGEPAVAGVEERERLG